jgi:hypothetical protein
LIAGTTQIPNQINMLYGFLLLSFAIIKVNFKLINSKSFFTAIFFPFLYTILFIIVSYFGVNFQFSIKYHVLYLPLLLIDFTLWYLVGFFYNEITFLRSFYKIATLFGFLSLFFVLIGVIDPEMNRIFSGVDLPFALSIAFVFGDFLYVGILFLIILFSIKKTIVVSSLLAILIPYILMKRLKIVSLNKNKVSFNKVKIRIDKKITSLILLITTILLLFIFSDYLFATFFRFQENDDIIRAAIAFEFASLFYHYFPTGTGFYTFGYLTKDTIPYSTYTSSGELIEDGVSLHNTIMHILLEGGAIISFIILIIYYNFFKVLKYFKKFVATKHLYVIFITLFCLGFFYGIFQQYHATRYYFGLLGLAFGVFNKYRVYPINSVINGK